MDNHDGSVSPDDFDLRRAATYFRRSLSTKDEIKVVIQKNVEAVDQELVKEDQVDGFVVREQVIEKRTITVDEDPSLTDYVEAYNELNKMFPKLGRLFSFIASDVGDKTRILSEHQASAVGHKYETIAGMLDYEKDEIKILDSNHVHHHHELPNGSRTLLRLHRALLFVVEFIDCIRQANDHDKMSHLARKAYDGTLALHHPWLVRQGVHLAVHTLPNRHQLFLDLAGPNVSQEEAEQVMQETVVAGRAVYDTVQKLYEQRQLLDLP